MGVRTKGRSPDLHTVSINSPVTMWEKLAWDVDVFDDIQRSYPKERQPITYAAINVCIAAESLRKWVKANLSRQGLSISDQEIHAAIPEQAMCEAIANTAKHANYHSDRWSGGVVRLVWEEGDEYGPGGFMLRSDDGQGGEAVLVLSSFIALRDAWWGFLAARNLTGDARQVPQWQQVKLSRIFGAIEIEPPPSQD